MKPKGDGQIESGLKNHYRPNNHSNMMGNKEASEMETHLHDD
jgi:hypothetical protein